MIYGGKLGERSKTMINYFQVKTLFIICSISFCSAKPTNNIASYQMESLFLSLTEYPIRKFLIRFFFSFVLRCLQGIGGVPKIPDGYNPATWMLEISSPAVEERIHQDFAVVYQNSQQYR